MKTPSGKYYNLLTDKIREIGLNYIIFLKYWREKIKEQKSLLFGTILWVPILLILAKSNYAKLFGLFWSWLICWMLVDEIFRLSEGGEKIKYRWI